MCNKDSNESTSKRKALELITNIFRKKTRDGGKARHKSEENLSHFCSIKTPDSIDNNSLSMLDGCLNTPTVSGYRIAPLSPISPRVKNIDLDMEALTLSRNDNPVISQTLERLSASGDFLSTSNLTLNISQTVGDNPNVGQSLISMDMDDLCDNSRSLHEHLIRSPPPQYPRYVSQFIFPLPGSPIGSLSLKNSSIISPSRVMNVETKDLGGSTTLEVPSLVHHRKSIALGETGQKDNHLSFISQCRKGFHVSLDNPKEQSDTHSDSGLVRAGNLSERSVSDQLSPSSTHAIDDVSYYPEMFSADEDAWSKEHLGSSREALIGTNSNLRKGC